METAARTWAEKADRLFTSQTVDEIRRAGRERGKRWARTMAPDTAADTARQHRLVAMASEVRAELLSEHDDLEAVQEAVRKAVWHHAAAEALERSVHAL